MKITIGVASSMRSAVFKMVLSAPAVVGVGIGGGFVQLPSAVGQNTLS